MTRERVRAAQAKQPSKPVTAVPITVTAVNPHTVTVTLPGGTTVAAPRGTWAYTVGATGWALIQEPAVIAVIPTA